jgi:Holliday junction resolvase RusA-like endonuclease
VKLTVDQKPISKARHRYARGIAYDPQSKEKQKLKWHFGQQMRSKGYLKLAEGPISASVTCFMSKPKSWSQKRLKEAEGSPVITKPDIDNVVKFYFDVLSGIAFSDDKQISSLWSEKIYSDEPGVVIEIKPIGEKMIDEHAKTVKEPITMEDLAYLVKKANTLGKMDREVKRIYAEEDDDGKHIYFVVEPLKER